MLGVVPLWVVEILVLVMVLPAGVVVPRIVIAIPLPGIVSGRCTLQGAHNGEPLLTP